MPWDFPTKVYLPIGSVEVPYFVMYILDTDHLSFIQRNGKEGKKILARLAILDNPEVAVTVITYEEQVRGRLSFLSKMLTFTFYQFDDSLHRHLRTTNHLERLFREFRTKSDEIGAFLNENSCLTLFWLVVERDHAKHDRRNYANNS
jgi:hypothetical protein